MSPIIEALAQDADLSQVVFIKVAHDQQELLKGLTAYLPEGKTSVPSIPYFFIFKDGKIVDQFTGSMAQAALKEKILKDKK
jgi:thioredoxin-like negative regulator of GroEL